MSHPQKIGRYQILRPIGSGAMGDVFLARDPNIDRDLAIKTVRVLGGTSGEIEERKQRLLREARAAGRLLHPHVVTLFDSDESDGLLYLAFEFVAGTDLAQRAVAQPPLTLRQVLTAGMQVATALDYAHGEGIVHRDIKPSNILITTRGDAKVADFGIAKINASSTELTRTGSVVGSPQYMSPEQVRGEHLDGRSDLFSLGVVLYELLCQTRPFAGETLSTLVFEILAKEPIAIDHLRPGLPPRLYRLVSTLMAKDRKERPASARQAVDELAALLAEIPPEQLEAPAGRQMAEGPTRRMPASDGVPGTPDGSPAAGGPPPLPYSAGGPRSPDHPDAPTSTQASPWAPPPPPTAGPPPVPSGPPGGAGRVGPGVSATPLGTASPLGAGPGSTPGAVPVPPPTSSLPPAGRPSPLDTGTYGGPGRGRRAIVVGAVVALLAVVLGFFLARTVFQQNHLGEDSAGASSGDSARTTTGESPSLAEGPTGGTVADETPDTSPTSTNAPASQTAPALPDPALPDPARPAPAQPTASQPTTSQPTTSQPTTSQPAASQPAVSQPAVSQPAASQPTTSQPTTSQPTAPSSTRPAPAADGELSSETGGSAGAGDLDPAPSSADRRAERRAAAFTAARARAFREIETGLRFRFDVQPDDTVVKVQQKGERSIVQGRVTDFEADEEDARDMELPADGEYLITLVHPGFGELTVLARAAASRGTTPHVVRLDLARARQLAEGGPRRLRASRGLLFAGQPADAEVWVDDEKRGIASELGGGRRGLRRDILQLDDGRHTVRLVAPGYEPLEIEVEITSSAPQRVQRVPYRLKRAAPGGAR